MEARSPAESHATLVKWMGITDANSAGFIHGGTVMKLCDEAAGVAAGKHCRGGGGRADEYSDVDLAVVAVPGREEDAWALRSDLAAVPGPPRRVLERSWPGARM